MGVDVLKGTKYTSKEELIKRALEIKGIPLKDIDSTGRLSTGKGAIGTVVEESWFGYSPNSDAEPDFPEAGVELKVTPYINTKKGRRAKERLVCNIINYMDEYDKTFETSAFWKKCNTMLLMSYEHIPEKSKGDYTIDEVYLFDLSKEEFKEDLAIIKHDWETIINKVRAGEAENISERDTNYLAACTKGANKNSLREQPFSDIPAMQRAYSLKPAYMTRILNTYIFGEKQSEKIITNSQELIKQTFEEYIKEKLKPYYGNTMAELKEKFGLEKDKTQKNIGEILLGKMLGIKGKISKTEEFQKANLQPKVIRINEDGLPRESLVLGGNIDFIKLTNEPWEESQFYHELEKRYVFIIYKNHKVKGEKKPNLDDSEFIGIKFWGIPDADFEEAHNVWEKTVETVKNGVVFKSISGNRTSNNLPKSTESKVAHVRPHGKNSKDTSLLPDGRTIVKQSFWLNRKYIGKQLLGVI